ncbi:MAG: Threonine-tRNA ligase [Candidatus Magasanikbacteria bacterium GW2011_GWC2_40_17]|uniref:Threonine--tRNA ligase n=1 Tax=Candidatus Magasanikbacteria bacterium GW2011_GWA2_42_32 TaxID=1619039 RepID=A0A0G1CCP4_9BACT|nr:MAG: Threonine-tRNA ligase [Candidatus Magasanikbacteria bacterium GW2011_GWC2_40_17]KKS56466.1 MAG: Threonine-tRNA ligase [Candidatus Magasanikbacteria bacterium GW2011_GWA2_42_32]
MRHSAAHLIAAAVENLYPGSKFGVGPVVENGFYYDIDFPQNIGEEELQKIEDKAKELIKANLKYERKEMPIDEAIKLFESKGQIYKVELLKDLKERGTTKMSGEELQEVGLAGSAVDSVSLYQTGDFIDLCRGPHLKSTKEINSDGLKLVRLAGAYWRGKNENPQLQRIYGVCFSSKEELENYLHMLEEAEKRDHRKIGAEQELFFFDDLVGKGLVMWLPKGTIIRNEIEKLAFEEETKGGYVRVRTPHLAKEEMYLKSGHLPYYKDSMYPPMVMDDGTYYMKAMNCPHHHIIYNHNLHSYRDLPLRIAEYGECYRNELSGTLAGLLRVRCLAMNDAHMYCRKDQIKQEFKGVLEMIINYFKIFKLENYWFRLSKWSPDHLEKYINEPENWEYSQKIIREVLQEMDVKFVEADDEAAFYGPKVDVQFKSIIGREETMSTVQLDFLARERFGLKYIDENGRENNEVFVIHRAPLSTHERFMAFLIEHFAGIWPVWLSPVQIQLVTVSSKFIEGATVLAKELKSSGLRVEVDNADETVGNRVRKAVEEKVPYIVVVGGRELEGEEWTIRLRGQEDQMKMSKKDFVEKVVEEIKNRS